MTYDVYWTKKVPLNAIIDPLGIRSLRDLEDIFLSGITTQTHIIRYLHFSMQEQAKGKLTCCKQKCNACSAIQPWSKCTLRLQKY